MNSYELAPRPDAAEIADQSPGFGIMNWLRDTRPGQLLTDFAMGAAVVLPGAGGTALALAEAQPAVAAGTAQAFTPIRQCVREGLAKPNITVAELLHPGDKHKQEFLSNPSYLSMYPGCQGEVTRSAFVRIQMENYRDHSQWIDMIRGKWLKLYVNVAQSTFDAVKIYPDGQSGKKILYHPTPGPEVTEARELIKNVVRDENGKKIGQKIYEEPVKVFAPYRKQ